MSRSAIQVRQLVKEYGRRTVVDGLDLEVLHGETVALLGPNGAGKSTTVEILEGLRRPSGGSVEVLGEDPALAGALWRGRLGIVLQEATDVAELTVGEVVRHFAHYYAEPADVDALIATVGLTEARDRRVRTLSGGQRRRVDVALALVGRPELVFLDEPTTGFDPAARRQFWEVIRALKAQGVTILLTTHYLEEAQELADRLVVIARGRVVAEGTSDSLAGTLGSASRLSWRDHSGRQRELWVDEPDRAIADLLARGEQLAGLSVERPSLEDTYLRLVEEES